MKKGVKFVAVDVYISVAISAWNLALFFSPLLSTVGFTFRDIHEGSILWINLAICFLVFLFSIVRKLTFSAICALMFGLASLMLTNARIFFN